MELGSIFLGRSLGADKGALGTGATLPRDSHYHRTHRRSPGTTSMVLFWSTWKFDVLQESRASTTVGVLVKTTVDFEKVFRRVRPTEGLHTDDADTMDEDLPKC